MTVMRLEFKGARKLVRKFEQLPRKLRGNTLIRVVMSGAKPIRDDARRRAPRRPGSGGGSLKREIRARVLSTGSDHASVGVGWRVGKASRTPAFHGLFIEKGTKQRKRKSGGRTGRVTAKPFLQPAFDTNKERAVSKMAEKFKAEIEKVARG